MSFLFLAGWWLSLLAIPITAFYLLKTRQRRRDVSSLLFWESLRPKVENNPFWKKLRRWLSLLIQLLILLLLVLALSKPAFDWEKAAPRHTVVIIDPSASMGAAVPQPGRWPLALNALSQAVSRLRVQDEMALITATDPPEILSGWNSSQKALHEALSPTSLLPGATDPSTAFRLAADLTSLRPGSTIAIYSDSVWPTGSWDSPLPNAEIIGLPDKPPINAGISLLAVRRSPVAPGDWQLDCEVVSTEFFSGNLELIRDGRPMDLIPVEASPGSPWRKSWRGSSESSASFEAKLLVEKDDILSADNSARCELPTLRTLDILLAGPSDPYLEAALESIPLVNFWKSDSLPTNLPPGTDLVIALGEAAPESPPAVPCLLINPPDEGFWGRKTGSVAESPVVVTQPPPTLLRHVTLTTILLENAPLWKPADGSAVVSSTPDAPLIFGMWDRPGNPWLVVGFDPSLSDFPLRTAFPIFLANVFQSLRDAGEETALAATLPGPVESGLIPVANSSHTANITPAPGPALPGWWIFAFLGLLAILAEWFLFHRRITE